MTTKPELKLGGHLLPGLAAVGLFVVMAGVFLTAQLSSPSGFPDGVSITANIGYAMFNLGGQATVPSEGFLVTFEIIDLVLVAALVGAVMLARKEVSGAVVNALASDEEEEPGAAATDGGTVDAAEADEGGDR